MAIDNQPTAPDTDAEIITLSKSELDSLINSIVERRIEGSLPPGTYRRAEDGLLYRDKSWTQDLEVLDPDNPGKTKWIQEPRTQHRHVTLDKDEAQRMHWDFWMPGLGWILEGYKLETDRPARDIFADTSSSQPRPMSTLEAASNGFRRPLTEGE